MLSCVHKADGDTLKEHLIFPNMNKFTLFTETWIVPQLVTPYVHRGGVSSAVLGDNLSDLGNQVITDLPNLAHGLVRARNLVLTLVSLEPSIY